MENTINFDKYLLIYSPVPVKCVNMSKVIIWIHNLFTTALNEKIIQKSFFFFLNSRHNSTEQHKINRLPASLYIPKCPDWHLDNIE